ncbi:MAG: 16S rRNA (guanine966-N2)-methyltransferase [Gammaproteobacteria bacterium]|jgi:16S rRNA (guanine966-N2)-methyltransferase
MAARRGTKALSGGTGKVRIIAGLWRGRQLPVMAFPGLRPTPDRVRETLFNWLSADLPGAACLDLFAGTGALGFEAASRGAQNVLMVERDASAAQHLRAQVRALGAQTMQVVCADATQWVVHPPGCFDLVFVDPPYGRVDLPPLLAALRTHGCVNAASKVYVETAADNNQPVFPENWQVLRDKRAGGVRYYLASPELV